MIQNGGKTRKRNSAEIHFPFLPILSRVAAGCPMVGLQREKGTCLMSVRFFYYHIFSPNLRWSLRWAFSVVPASPWRNGLGMVGGTQDLMDPVRSPPGWRPSSYRVAHPLLEFHSAALLTAKSFSPSGCPFDDNMYMQVVYFQSLSLGLPLRWRQETGQGKQSLTAKHGVWPGSLVEAGLLNREDGRPLLHPLGGVALRCSHQVRRHSCPHWAHGAGAAPVSVPWWCARACTCVLTD